MLHIYFCKWYKSFKINYQEKIYIIKKYPIRVKRINPFGVGKLMSLKKLAK